MKWDPQSVPSDLCPFKPASGQPVNPPLLLYKLVNSFCIKNNHRQETEQFPRKLTLRASKPKKTPKGSFNG